MSFDKTPYERGESDSYYMRINPKPHKIVGGSRVEALSDDEVKQYRAGFSDNEKLGDHKDY